MLIYCMKLCTYYLINIFQHKIIIIELMMYFGPVFIVHIDIQPEKLKFFSKVKIFIISDMLFLSYYVTKLCNFFFFLI